MKNVDKRRTIARSSLASRYSAPLRRRGVHQAERSRVRNVIRHLEILHAAGVDVEDLDGFDAERDSLRYRVEIADLVDRRRDADNLGALWNWVAAQLRRRDALWLMDVDSEEVADLTVWCRREFPDTVAGRHAANHAASFIASHRRFTEQQLSRRRHNADHTRGVLVKHARTAIANGQHRAINRLVRPRHDDNNTGRPHRRTLAGMHDIEDWVEAHGDHDVREILDRIALDIPADQLNTPAGPSRLHR